jgi:2'-5' RNA ligase
MSIQKIFVAIRVPEDEITQWHQAQVRLKKEIKNSEIDVKWTLPGNFHVSLVFLGPTGEDQVVQLQKIVSEVAANYHPFKLDIHGMGAFSNILRARVLYLGVQNKKILRALQGELVQALKGQSDRPLTGGDEEAQFVPHMTVLRFRNPHAVRDLISPFLRKKWGEVEVSELIIYKSEMRGLYPVYTPLFRTTLTGLTH